MIEQLTLDSLMQEVEEVKCKDIIPLSVKSYIWSREKIYKAYLKGLYDLASHMSKFKKEIITDYGNNINVGAYIEHLKERKGDATEKFINEVQRYILNNYNFEVSFDFLNDKNKRKKVVSYDDFEKVLIVHDFEDEGYQTLKKEIRKEFCFENIRNEITIKNTKNKVTISRGFYGEDWIGDYRIYMWRNSEKQRALLKGFAYFEHEILDGISPEFSSHWPDEVKDFSMIYEFPLSRRIKGVKFFKNGRTDIIFRTNDEAKKFMELFF